MWSSTTFAKDKTAFIRQVRSIETDDLGILNPVGISFSIRANTFHVFSGRGPAQQPSPVADIFILMPTEDPVGSVRIAADINSQINMAFDNKANRLLIFESTNKQLIEVKTGPEGNLDPNMISFHKAHHFGLKNPQGMTVDPESGHLFILDATGPRLVRVETDPDRGLDKVHISQVDLQSTGLLDPRGLALNPDTGHFHSLSPDKKELYELTKAGQLVAIRDVGSFELNDPQGMVFAPSGDLTDDPSQLSLYLADSGLTALGKQGVNPSQNGQIVELSLTEPSFSLGRKRNNLVTYFR
jgi:uncharacterized protein YjiK